AARHRAGGVRDGRLSHPVPGAMGAPAHHRRAGDPTSARDRGAWRHHRFSSPLTAARTNLGPAWLRWLIFPHNVNYHVEHHLYASVPQYNLPRVHAEMKRQGMLEGAEVVPFGTTLRKVFAERRSARGAV